MSNLAQIEYQEAPIEFQTIEVAEFMVLAGAPCQGDNLSWFGPCQYPAQTIAADMYGLWAMCHGCMELMGVL